MIEQLLEDYRLKVEIGEKKLKLQDQELKKKMKLIKNENNDQFKWMSVKTK